MDLSHSASAAASPINNPPVAARDIKALPPDHICDAYWKYNKAKPAEIAADESIIDFTRGLSDEQKSKLQVIGTIGAETISKATRDFLKYGRSVKYEIDEDGVDQHPSCTVYEHADFPGLRLYPSLLPPSAQLRFVSSIMHRDLAKSAHTTNINIDYHVPPAPVPPPRDPIFSTYASYFAAHPDAADAENLLIPKGTSKTETEPNSKPGEMKIQDDTSQTNENPATNETTTTTSPNSQPPSKPPLTPSHHLRRKLRYLTLGHQYTWSTRSYSGRDTTPFPPDIATLVTGLFPFLRPESGVVLLYGKRDFMPVHRDVSEVCERGLVSFSLGCDGVFVLGGEVEEGGWEGEGVRRTLLEGGSKNGWEGKGKGRTVAIRVRSGDVIQMAEESRWAWHAMPRIIAGTCPNFMGSWPAGSEVGEGAKDGTFERWRGYMAGKRINVSCRQVWD